MKRICTRSACSSATSRSISSVNSSIRSSTSAPGRVQFSVENENTVRSFTPASDAARTTRFSARAPARWPAPTGRCRSRAHRPLPSMMIAMDSGISVGPEGGSVRGARPSPSTARAVRRRVSRVRARPQTSRISASLRPMRSSMVLTSASVSFWTSSSARFSSSRESSPSFSAFFRS